MEGFRKRGGMYSSPHQMTPNSTNRARRETLDVYRHDREKGANIQVILRCRPLNDEEVKAKAACIITCNENRGEVSAMHNIANKQIGKNFEFDKVFGPTSQQNDIFDHAISPMVNEVLEGYNCTVFAYGQTGTGKTYTMEGGKTKNGDFPEDAGVISRSVRQIFDILESQNAEYSMKVTFLELYNEEITDLLAPESKFSDDKLKKPLALMEDGKGGVLVRGLEEEIVTSASEIYKILDEGSAKKHTAESLLNKQSSRSHSIFSITIHIKECTPEGEELIKCGKLNLVDLAGSENITRSGARDGRAREAGEINKSLLTLGRVINALVDHSAHIPYRDSKLTRLLRDSLGGKTKTCIIATISPSIHCLEDSLSTLDYAYRAKNIKNKPEVNQKLMKSELIKDLYSEIDRLKQELHAAREKNGVYIPTECYIQDEAKKKAMTEKVEQFKLELIFKEKKFVEIQNLYNSQKHINEEQSRELEKTLSKFEDTGHAFFQLEERYRQAKQTIREKDHFISNLLKSEKALVQHAHGLRSELEDVALDVPGLFAKIDRKDTIEEENRAVVQKFHARLSQQLDLLHTTVSSSVPQQENQLKEVEEEMLAFVATKSKATEKICGQVGKLKDSCNSGIRALNYFANELDANTKSTFDKINSQIDMHHSTMQKSFESIAIEASKLQKELDNNLSKLEEKISSFAKKQREGLLRTADTTRSISNVINNFFDGLEMQSSKLNVILEERQQVQDQQFCALEKKFEEFSAYEEKILLEKLSELVACSRVRKQELVQVAVSDLRACTADNTSTLGNEISAACKINSSVRNEWAAFIEKAENNYLKDTALIDTQQNYFVEGLKQCMDNRKCNAQKWEKAQEFIKNVNGETVASVSSFISAGSEINQLLQSKHTSAAATTTNDVNEADENLISSIKCSLKLDHDIKDGIHCATLPYHEELKGLLSGHDHRVSEIKDDSRNHLEVEYKMDQPTCSTPKRRMVNVPSMIPIEETRTPALEESLKSFSEPKFCSALKQPLNGEGRESSGAYDSSNIRLPFTTINKLV